MLTRRELFALVLATPFARFLPKAAPMRPRLTRLAFHPVAFVFVMAPLEISAMFNAAPGVSKAFREGTIASMEESAP